MVKRKTSGYSEDSPQFFKIFFPDQRLRIPPAFIKYFKNDIPFKSILKTTAKRSWHVDVNKVDKYLYFESGWQEFVQINSLKEGDFLVFSYNGNSEFDVSVFGKNSCQKQLPLLQMNQTCPDSVETLILHSRRPEPVQENIEALQTPKFNSKNPFFEVVLKPSYIHSGMNIPAEFASRYMHTDKSTATLKHSNKSWVVKLLRYTNKLVFSGGWPEFVAANTLQQNDACSFELITTRSDCVFKVAIREAKGTRTTH